MAPTRLRRQQTAPQIGAASIRTREARKRLILLALGFQSLTLGAAWCITVGGTRHQVGVAVGDKLLEQNAQTADSVEKVLTGMRLGHVAFGDANWVQCQNIVDQFRMAGNGYLSIIDASGRILCHPDIRTNPSLRETNIAGIPLRHAGEPTSLTIGQITTGTAMTGEVSFGPGNDHYVAVKHIPGLNVKLLVHQPERTMAGFSTAALQGTMLAAGVMGLMALFTTTWISAKLMRRHDQQLEAVNTGLEAEVAWRVDQSMRTSHALITGLAKLADYRDTDTGSHLDRIAAYSVLLAETLKGRWPFVTELWQEHLQLASTMHDIGKVGINDAILLKPGKFTPEERRIMERHASIGADTLAEVRRDMGNDEMMDMCIDVARHHHERWDGKGYPAQLAGEDIPHAARIVALADVYDALTSKRVYKEAMKHDKVVEMLREGSGTQFDPDVVAAFLKVEAEFDTIRAKLQPLEVQLSKLAQAA